jgi:hypothetical protein
MDDNLLNSIELNDKYEQKVDVKESKKNKRKHKEDGDDNDDDDEERKKKNAKYDDFLAKDKEEDAKLKGILSVELLFRLV